MVARPSGTQAHIKSSFTSLVKSLWEHVVFRKIMWWAYQEYIWRHCWCRNEHLQVGTTAGPIKKIAITSASCQAALLWFVETLQPRFEYACGWWEANFQHCSFKLWVVSCTQPGYRIQRVLFAPRGTTWILCQVSQACSSLFLLALWTGTCAGASVPALDHWSYAAEARLAFFYHAS